MHTYFHRDEEAYPMKVEIKGVPEGRSFRPAGGQETINWHIETPTAKVYYPVAKAERGLLLIGFRAFSLSGSGEVTVAVDGTPVDDLTALAVTTTPTDTAVTGTVTVAEGDAVTVEVTDAGDMADLVFALTFR